MLITPPPAPPQTDADSGRLRAITTTIKIRLLLSNGKFNCLVLGITDGDFEVYRLNIALVYKFYVNSIEKYVASNTSCGQNE